MIQKITPHLWYGKYARKIAELYISVLDGMLQNKDKKKIALVTD
jgi:predicted 3-demethylubiquinone-9 3-methyltransferase (glyoxalase superfamily)